jgi:hypothetical protein
MRFNTQLEVGCFLYMSTWLNRRSASPEVSPEASPEASQKLPQKLSQKLPQELPRSFPEASPEAFPEASPEASQKAITITQVSQGKLNVNINLKAVTQVSQGKLNVNINLTCQRRRNFEGVLTDVSTVVAGCIAP